MGSINNNMETLRIIVALGIFFLGDAWKLCPPTPNCTVQFNGQGVCVDMQKVDIRNISMAFDVKAGTVQNVCRGLNGYECCRCLKEKDCTQMKTCTKKFKKFKAECFKQDKEPFGYSRFGDEDACLKTECCYCYGKCPQNGKCKKAGGECTTTRKLGQLPIKCKGSSAGCRCNCIDTTICELAGGFCRNPIPGVAPIKPNLCASKKCQCYPYNATMPAL